MKYCSAYLWEKGEEEENAVSLMLQQVRVAKKAVLFGCVCGMEKNISGRFSEALVEWFHREGLEMLERKCSLAELEKSLEKEVNEVVEEIRQYRHKKQVEARLEYVGILLVEQWFCLFGSGNMQVFLMNRRFNRKHLRCVVGEHDRPNIGHQRTFGEKEEQNGKPFWQSGEVQRKVGVLLCTPGFLEGMEREAVAEILMPEGELKEERMQKRLQELWEVTKKTAGSTAAVYLQID